MKALKKIPSWVPTALTLAGMIVAGYAWATGTFASKDTMTVVLQIVSETHNDVREIRKDLKDHLVEE